MAVTVEKKTATGQDLQSFLRFLEENYPDEVIRVSREIDPVFEATAALWRLENDAAVPGSSCSTTSRGRDFPCVTNVHASFPRLAMAIGPPIDATPRDFVLEYVRREENPIPPKLVSNDEAPCKEVILTGDDVDLTIFPSLKYHELDSGQVDPGFESWQGRYWTLAYETMKDPDTGVPNVGHLPAPGQEQEQGRHPDLGDRARALHHAEEHQAWPSDADGRLQRRPPGGRARLPELHGDRRRRVLDRRRDARRAARDGQVRDDRRRGARVGGDRARVRDPSRPSASPRRRSASTRAPTARSGTTRSST